MFTGIKSIIYPSTDLEADTKFWIAVLGVEPYFNQPYYVGFSVEGCELGLDPNASKEGLTYPVGYWHVKSVMESSDAILKSGATVHTAAKDVGGGMMMATFKDAGGNIFGIIDDPNA